MIQTYKHLRQVLVGAHPTLPGRLRQIAEYALAHPDDMALETIAVLSERSEVSPSGMVRFARALGFSGFTEMQKGFREGLLHHMPDYRARIHAARSPHPLSREPHDSRALWKPESPRSST